VTIGRNVPLSEAGWTTTNHNFAFSAIDLFLYPGLESPEDIGAVLKFRFFAQRIVSTEAASETNGNKKQVYATTSGHTAGS
jgi:hypothetical protein